MVKEFTAYWSKKKETKKSTHLTSLDTLYSFPNVRKHNLSHTFWLEDIFRYWSLVLSLRGNPSMTCYLKFLLHYTGTHKEKFLLATIWTSFFSWKTVSCERLYLLLKDINIIFALNLFRTRALKQIGARSFQLFRKSSPNKL